ncbi:hypothetical protein OR571_07205 [Psychrobacillus sp. NEAU-3TGS]|uniref:hypothetical protein n=1 Tax=Psychrobacillus sp. NEAU-3TGS TaxID=2995412 RepID=UPI002496F375|nr:hypothetical protein [Psychrobacillus sp. NEAU-3TGS]MDI2586897.1 hypothetical protein [Psychrobacillus sp. NEAU-3TGS]
MNKKQMESKKANKNLSKKVAPLVMSTSMMAATFLAAGAPISAAELDTKEVNPEVIEHVKNHGQEVSALARSLSGSPEKGELVSKLARVHSETTDDNPDNKDNIDDTTAEESEAPAAEEVQEADETEAVEDESAEEAEAPTAEEGQEADANRSSRRRISRRRPKYRQLKKVSQKHRQLKKVKKQTKQKQ